MLFKKVFQLHSLGLYAFENMYTVLLFGCKLVTLMNAKCEHPLDNFL